MVSLEKMFTTNEHGEYIERSIFAGAALSGVCTAEKESKESMGFLGCGVAITGSSCYNLSLMKKEERIALLEELYTKKGLGFNIARLTVGASDYSGELYSYDDAEFDTELEHFSIDRDMAYIIPVIKEIKEINPDIKFFASPWSPPGWMKTGGSIGGGYMRRKYLSCYADYFVKYIEAYREQGIDIYAVTPQNEPETQQGGTMPACIWHPDLEAEFVLMLKAKFEQNSINTKIWLFDHNFSSVKRVMWCLEEYPELLDTLDGVAFHYYGGNVTETERISEKYPSLSLHFTEGGPRLYDNYATDWCKWGLMLIKALKSGYSSFTGWNLMLDETGGPNVGPFFCGGLVTRNFVSGELSFSGQYKAFKHIAPFINEASKIHTLSISGQEDAMFGYNGKKEYSAEGVSVENADGKQILILVNPKDTKMQVQYEKNGEWYYIELLPKTIATIVFN